MVVRRSSPSRVYCFYKGLFRSLSNIQDGGFCKNNYAVKAVNCFRKTFHLRYLIKFLIWPCIRLFKNYPLPLPCLNRALILSFDNIYCGLQFEKSHITFDFINILIHIFIKIFILISKMTISCVMIMSRYCCLFRQNKSTKL